MSQQKRKASHPSIKQCFCSKPKKEMSLKKVDFWAGLKMCNTRN